MEKKYSKKRLIIIVVVLLLIAISIYLIFFSKLPQGEKVIELEGKLIKFYDRYEITAIQTSDGKNWWIYGSTNEFDNYINKTIKIKAILSPLENSICTRSCQNCQCPNRELLYQVEVIS